MEEATTLLTPSTRRRRMRLQRAGPIAVLLIGLAAFLPACGGGSGASSSPTTNAPSASPSSSSQSGAVAFAQCVRSHGVADFPDPQNGHFLIGGNDQNNPSFQSAVQACQHLLPGGSASNGGSSGGSNTSELLAFAQCMQTHGVPQFPDPTPNGGIGLPQGVDPNSPQFQQAWQTCQSKLPQNLQGQQP